MQSLLNSPSALRGTPRGDPAPKIPANLTIAEYPSPYEALKQEHQAGSSAHAAAGAGTGAASASEGVAGMTAKLPAISQTPLRAAAQADPQTRRRHGGGRGQATGEDVLLHRVLDKTYRIQATPHKTPASQIRTRRYHVSGLGGGSTKAGVDSSPPSSPEMPPPPQLNPDVFSPSTRRRIVAVNSAKKARQAGGPGPGPGQVTGTGAASGIGSRTPNPKLRPGVSVLHTPRQRQPSLHGATVHASGRLFSSEKGGSRPGLFEADAAAARPSGQNEREHGSDEQAGASDSSSDEWGDIEGMSPPKTIQFAIPPSRLLRTPGESCPTISGGGCSSGCPCSSTSGLEKRYIVCLSSVCLCIALSFPMYDSAPGFPPLFIADFCVSFLSEHFILSILSPSLGQSSLQPRKYSLPSECHSCCSQSFPTPAHPPSTISGTRDQRAF